MKALNVLLASAAVAVWLAGCDGDNGNGQPSVPMAPGPAPTAPVTVPAAPGPATTATVTDFSVFIRQLLASTAENTEPVPLGTIIFSNQLAEGDPQPITFFLP